MSTHYERDAVSGSENRTERLTVRTTPSRRIIRLELKNRTRGTGESDRAVLRLPYNTSSECDLPLGSNPGEEPQVSELKDKGQPHVSAVLSTLHGELGGQQALDRQQRGRSGPQKTHVPFHRNNHQTRVHQPHKTHEPTGVSTATRPENPKAEVPSLGREPQTRRSPACLPDKHRLVDAEGPGSALMHPCSIYPRGVCREPPHLSL